MVDFEFYAQFLGRLYKEGKTKEASDKYSQALGMLEQLMLRLQIRNAACNKNGFPKIILFFC